MLRSFFFSLLQSKCRAILPSHGQINIEAKDGIDTEVVLVSKYRNPRDSCDQTQVI